jgi:hypothetical protein
MAMFWLFFASVVIGAIGGWLGAGVSNASRRRRLKGVRRYRRRIAGEHRRIE